MRAAGTALVLAGVLALTGCTSSSTVIRDETPSATAAPRPAGPSPAPSPTASPVPGVLPVAPSAFTETALAAESKRTADAVQALIDPGAIVNVDDHSQLVTKNDGTGHYYGILRTITLVPATDATHLAQSMAATLLASGWLSRDSSDKGEVYLTGLASATDDASSWFLVIGGDDTTQGQSALSIQMASPDIRP
ncbi:hypothetical protein [Cryobacterium tepidiphilum]|uniref:Uncharacterized protein n=1 Tax=Cryobacterium tepidiphilum TaxID=2486026 RepID=A0A3M8LC88_9MICO|nr:hypothetical protein [Cryobacterium tepidiphilum]RNE62284.1 hypothetical protein EEJ31_08655 [Cryobacterium tepidiphilum]